MSNQKRYSNLSGNIKMSYYRDRETFEEIRSISFASEKSGGFPGSIVSEIRFPNKLAVGQEVVLPAVFLRKGKAIRLVFRSDALAVIGNCEVGENAFEFPARKCEVIWYLIFLFSDFNDHGFQL
jgi:hypothetical protein